MKKLFKYSLIASFLLILSIDSPGKPVELTGRFGEDRFMLPRQIIVSGEEIFVLDEYGNLTSGDEKILVFTRDGKFKQEFGKGGQGPGEFGEAMGFDINNRKIYILDSRRRQIHIFSEKEKKHLESKPIHRGNASNAPFTTPTDFCVARDESIYFTAGRSIKGQKIITKLDHDFKSQVNFLDCIAVYENWNDLYLTNTKKGNQPETVRNRYKNLGYITMSENKIYFSYWLLNKVLEFSPDGNLLKRYNLPVESIEQTVEVIQSGNFFTIDRKLNYDMINAEGCVYVLSRDSKGDSIIYELNDGKFKEKYRIKEQLFDFDISDNRLYGIERDECHISIYNLK